MGIIETIKAFNDSLTPFANLLGLVGFLITIFGVWQAFNQASKAKTSAEAARDAALSATTKLSKYDAISELTRAKSAAEEIRRYQSGKFWSLLPVSYNALASVLEEMESFAQVLTSQEFIDLGLIISFARDKEETTYEAIEEEKPLNGAKLNRELGEHTRVLGRILGRLKKELEGTHESN